MKPKIGDYILLGGLLVLSFVWFFLPKQDGSFVEIAVDGVVVETCSLDTDARIVLDALTVVIENGQVWVEDAVCPDLLCQSHAPISRVGEGIFCLPERVSVQIPGEAEVDAVA